MSLCESAQSWSEYFTANLACKFNFHCICEFTNPREFILSQDRWFAPRNHHWWCGPITKQRWFWGGMCGCAETFSLWTIGLVEKSLSCYFGCALSTYFTLQKRQLNAIIPSVPIIQITGQNKAIAGDDILIPCRDWSKQKISRHVQEGRITQSAQNIRLNAQLSWADHTGAVPDGYFGELPGMIHISILRLKSSVKGSYQSSNYFDFPLLNLSMFKKHSYPGFPLDRKPGDQATREAPVKQTCAWRYPHH